MKVGKSVIRHKQREEQEETGRQGRKSRLTEEPNCPLCGKPLIDEKSGIWCLNPDCEVLDDYTMYGEII